MQFSSIFVFFYSHIVEKVLFLNQISENEILLKFYILRSPKSKNRVFSGRIVCVSVNEFDVRTTQRQIIVRSLNFIH